MTLALVRLACAKPMLSEIRKSRRCQNKTRSDIELAVNVRCEGDIDMAIYNPAPLPQI